MIPRRVYLVRRVLVGLALVAVVALATAGYLWAVTSLGAPCFISTIGGAA